jgi:hypothetical protein
MLAVGVMTHSIAILAFTDSSSFSLYLSIAVLIAGIVCTSVLSFLITARKKFIMDS